MAVEEGAPSTDEVSQVLEPALAAKEGERAAEEPSAEEGADNSKDEEVPLESTAILQKTEIQVCLSWLLSTVSLTLVLAVVCRSCHGQSERIRAQLFLIMQVTYRAWLRDYERKWKGPRCENKDLDAIFRTTRILGAIALGISKHQIPMLQHKGTDKILGAYVAGIQALTEFWAHMRPEFSTKHFWPHFGYI